MYQWWVKGYRYKIKVKTAVMAGAGAGGDQEELLTVESEPRFRGLPTLPAALTQIFLCIAQIILVFVLPSLYDRHAHAPSGIGFGSFSVLIYTHGAHWAAFLIIDQFLHHHHHKSRLQVKYKFKFRARRGCAG